MKAKLQLNTEKRAENPTGLRFTNGERMNESKYKRAYHASHGQACTILQAIQLNGRQRLSPVCVEQLAEQVASAWESKESEESRATLVKLMNQLLEHATFLPNESLNQALVKYCEQEATTLASVCPSVCLLVAIDYVRQLKQRYRQIKGTPGCGQRLVLIAFIMASKYIHVNLKSIITHTTVLPSPPTSPTHPSHYHYFQSPQEKETAQAYTHSPRLAVSRMEIEFLHFLNFDLSLHHTLLLTRWAKHFDDHLP
ncbi:hypothetical protein BY458DRAFT_513758 [Sporodiniella umbellata]|nr:hypothetical protein BY458DRAFT_513758 [Sporodiniella umbellata]